MFTELELPYIAQSPGDAPHSRFSATPRTFHKGSSSESSQKSTVKDNSSVGEDEALNVKDAAAGARDDGLAVSVDGKNSDLNLYTDDRVFEEGSEFLSEGASAAENNFFGAGQDLKIGDGNVFDTSDPETAQAAINSAANVSADAFGFGQSTVEESFELGAQAQDSLSGALENVIQFAQITQQEANELTKQTNDVLSTKSSDADSAVSETLQKNLLIGLTLVGLIFAFKK